MLATWLVELNYGTRVRRCTEVAAGAETNNFVMGSASRKFLSFDSTQVAARLRTWFGVAGKDIRDAELELAGMILPNLFGYHIVQLGNHVSEEFFATTRISHALLIANDTSQEHHPGIVGRYDALPLAGDSIDVLVVPHILEFAVEPHAVLREAERVLIGEGHIVIVGFNPWSLCGLWRKLARWRGGPPWSGHFLPASRIKDWLRLVGFEIEFLKKVSFRPPLRRGTISAKLGFVEQLGSHCWPFFGNVYVVVARKHIAAITPLKSSWQTRRQMIAGGVAEPTARARANLQNRQNRVQ